MDLKHIKKLITLVEESNISGLKLEEDGTAIEIKKETTVVSAAPANQTIPVAPSPPPPAAEPAASATPTTPESDSKSSGTAIKSPMVGTFYQASSPEDPPFVKVGDRVGKGDVLCIIEAMKLFNEIESDVSGVIEKVLVENGNPVDYGQELFIIRAS